MNEFNVIDLFKNDLNRLVGGSSVQKVRELIENGELFDALELLRKVPQTTAYANQAKINIIKGLKDLCKNGEEIGNNNEPLTEDKTDVNVEDIDDTTTDVNVDVEKSKDEESKEVENNNEPLTEDKNDVNIEVENVDGEESKDEESKDEESKDEESKDEESKDDLIEDKEIENVEEPLTETKTEVEEVEKKEEVVEVEEKPKKTTTRKKATTKKVVVEEPIEEKDVFDELSEEGFITK